MAANFRDYKDVPDLAEAVARHLTGHPCIVRLQPPSLDQAWGVAMKHDGVGYIDLDPSQPEALIYKVFLHECAHIKAEWSDFTECNSAEIAAPPRSEVYSAETFARIVESQSEKQADFLAIKWGKWADIYHDKKYNPLVDRLLALLEYPTDEQKSFNLDERDELKALQQKFGWTSNLK
jgi:hypothetical protein